MEIEFWHWWVGALALAVLEALLPGSFMIWLAAAAGAVGVLLIPFDLDWRFQLLAFAVFSVLGVLASIFVFRQRPFRSENPSLNQWGDRFVGRTVTLESAIREGRGRAMIGDSAWTVTGEDMPAGTRVRVVGADGTALKVQRTD